MIRLSRVPVGRHFIDEAAFLWLSRNRSTLTPHIRLNDLVRLDERVEAHVDALRGAGARAKVVAPKSPPSHTPGAFFAAGVLAAEAADAAVFDEIVERAFAAEEPLDREAYSATYDPWRGLVSALAWVDAAHAARAVDRLLQAARPRERWLGIAACGARRGVHEQALERALADPETLVRARAYRTAGELGRRDLLARLASAFGDEDPECRFWAAWAAARMGASEPLNSLSEIAWRGGSRASRALDLLLRRLDVTRANAWLREFARLPERRRDLIRATGVIGDPLYIPWLIERMSEPNAARPAGEAFSMITGVDLAYRDLDRGPPADFQSGPNDDPDDENVALDEDDRLPWPDPAKVAGWWARNKPRFGVGTAYFLGEPKASADWLAALSDAFQHQRRAAALELAIRQPDKAMFEVRARGRLQRQRLARAIAER